MGRAAGLPREAPQDLALAERYTELKTTLGRQFGEDREGYTEAKTEFIRSALLPPA